MEHRYTTGGVRGCLDATSTITGVCGEGTSSGRRCNGSVGTAVGAMPPDSFHSRKGSVHGREGGRETAATGAYTYRSKNGVRLRVARRRQSRPSSVPSKPRRVTNPPQRCGTPDGGDAVPLVAVRIRGEGAAERRSLRRVASDWDYQSVAMGPRSRQSHRRPASNGYQPSVAGVVELGSVHGKGYAAGRSTMVVGLS
ncbi:hypothetical protein DFP72DRAFT_858701 [Ephemerocybe angulata]|uniref:Uncharacterized protein n=1 Tax=Ephemerocybe angulata TaxID=980116 RepID=A0A8H6HD12_9AGAR|nr:hypothetical protein DFP72DRAFT_858701 [Tulosesus angulatus]